MRTIATMGLVSAVLAGVSSAQQFAELGKFRIPRLRTAAAEIVLADFDADGDLDIVVGDNAYYVNRWARNRLYLNDGHGFYADRSDWLPDTRSTEQVAAGDIDGDGDLDLVLAARSWLSRSDNRLYVNDGGAHFTDVTTGRLPADPGETVTSVALGDVDGDGDLDIVFGNWCSYYYSGQNRLYLNDGAGIFADATARLPAVRDCTTRVVLADVDGDGDLDLTSATLDGATAQDRLYLNDGAGYFSDATATHFPRDEVRTYGLAIGDVDGDGDPDIVFADDAGYSPEPPRLYRNDGSGHFGASTAAFSAGVRGAYSVTLTDLDGDGDLDAIFGLLSGTASTALFLNDGSGRFVADAAGRVPDKQSSLYTIAAGDIDGDGDVDLLLGTNAPMDHPLINDGRGFFADSTDTGMPVSLVRSKALALGDIDRDGDLDIVFANDEAPSRLVRNDGYGTFAQTQPFETFFGVNLYNDVALVDIDADGDLDLLLTAQAIWQGDRRVDGQTQVFLNKNGTFTRNTAARMPTDPTLSATAMATGDVDGDGDADLVLAVAGTGTRLYLNKNGTFADATAANLPALHDFVTDALLGDVDGDGDLDLILPADFDATRSRSRLLLNSGKGKFDDVSATHLPVLPMEFPKTGALADVDGDGDLDLCLVGNQRDRLFLNDGRGRFTDATDLRLPLAGSQTVAFGDIDEDGDLDLVTAGYQFVRLAYNNGNGSFLTFTEIANDSVGCTDLALVDLDEDGDLDLVLANASGFPLRNQVFYNQHIHLHAPFAARPARPYRFDVTAQPRYAATEHTVVPLVAPRAAHIPLPPLGVFGLDPTAVIKLPTVSIPRPGGTASLQLRFPGDAALIGQDFYAQAFFVDHAGRGRLSATIRDTVH